jgi:MFS family permease
LSVPSVVRCRPHATAFAGVFAATLTAFLAVGAVLPVLPRYVTGPLAGGDVEVGLVTGAFAITAVIGRPIGGRIADRRGRRLIVVAGLLITALAGLLLFLPFGVTGLVVSRLVVGVGTGWVFTAGLAWTVDLAPVARRGEAIGTYGLGVWGGLSIGPLIGELLLAAGSYEAVWAFSALAPLAGAAIARAVPDRKGAPDDGGPRTLLPRAAVGPGVALLLSSLGYATLAGFVVLHLDELGAGNGAAVFTAFATTVVVVRLALARLPDRLGPRRTATAAAAAQAVGLTLVAVTGGLAVALAGAIVMGAGFSLLFPSLALLVVERVDAAQRGAAMGAFSAFFDVGIGVGAPLAGAVSALAGYPAAFGVAAAAAALAVLVGLSPSRA